MTFYNESYGDNQLADMDLGKKIMSKLEKYYAGHSWFVDVSHEAGTASIQLMYLADNKPKLWKWGYLLHVKNLQNEDSIDKKVMLAAGEILERYKLYRGKATIESEVLAAINGLDTSNSVN